MQNGHVESFNGRFGNQCLDTNWFTGRAHARKMISEWRVDYNGQRRRRLLQYQTPSELATLFQQHLTKPTNYHTIYPDRGRHLKPNRLQPKQPQY